jgi:hypothetical protein
MLALAKSRHRLLFLFGGAGQPLRDPPAMPQIDPLALHIAKAIDAYRKDYPALRVRRIVKALNDIADELEQALPNQPFDRPARRPDSRV